MKKTGHRTRPIKKEFFVDEEENHRLNEMMKQTGMTFSQLARDAILQGDIRVIDFPTLKELRYELHKIGVNVNQIAKRVNENDQARASDLKACLEELELVRSLVNRLIETELKKEV